MLGHTLAIAAGGAAGALLRYYASAGVYALLGRGFPYGTLVVNVVGSFAMGLAYVWLVERPGADALLRMALTIGVLGAFTTFSTFSLETVELLQDGRLLAALANALASVALCVAVCWLGIMLARGAL